MAAPTPSLRKCNMSLLTPAEKAIQDAISAVMDEHLRAALS